MAEGPRPAQVPPSLGRALEVLLPHGSVPLGYATHDGLVYLIARERSAQWPIELLRAQWAQLRWAGGGSSGAVELVSEPAEREQIFALFRSKYGDEGFRRWYEHPARVLRVRPADAGPAASGERYYAWIQTEFDNIADEYDRHITGNRMNMLLRNRSLARLRPLFAGRDPILEVGCGSGMETLPMLRAGHEMTVVDISDRMLDVVRAKAEQAGTGERLHAVLSRARDLEALVDELGASRFAGAYCTYGALNCEAELEPVARGFARLLAPGAPLFLGVYNRWCLFELVGYGLTLRPERALGRRGHPVRVGGSRFCVDVYAYTPEEVETAFAPYFVPRALEGVPVLLPPSDLTLHAERFSRKFATLAGWDARIGAWWPFRSLGDHFLLTLERTPVPVAPDAPESRAAS